MRKWCALFCPWRLFVYVGPQISVSVWIQLTLYFIFCRKGPSLNSDFGVTILLDGEWNKGEMLVLFIFNHSDLKGENGTICISERQWGLQISLLCIEVVQVHKKTVALLNRKYLLGWWFFNTLLSMFAFLKICLRRNWLILSHLSSYGI